MVLLYASSHRQNNTYHRLCYTSRGALAGMREREMFYLMTHSTHFIYGYMASDIWLRTILIVRKETRCRHIGYSYRLAARVLLYAPSHRQDSTYHGLCYTSCGALAGTRISSVGSIDPMTHRTTSERSYYGATSRSIWSNWVVLSKLSNLNTVTRRCRCH